MHGQYLSACFRSPYSLRLFCAWACRTTLDGVVPASSATALMHGVGVGPQIQFLVRGGRLDRHSIRRRAADAEVGCAAGAGLPLPVRNLLSADRLLETVEQWRRTQEAGGRPALLQGALPAGPGFSAALELVLLPLSPEPEGQPLALGQLVVTGVDGKARAACRQGDTAIWGEDTHLLDWDPVQMRWHCRRHGQPSAHAAAFQVCDGCSGC